MANTTRHWGSFSRGHGWRAAARGRGGGAHTRRAVGGPLPGTTVPPPSGDRGYPPVTAAGGLHGATFVIEPVLDAGAVRGGGGQGLIVGADDQHGRVGPAEWEGGRPPRPPRTPRGAIHTPPCGSWIWGGSFVCFGCVVSGRARGRRDGTPRASGRASKGPPAAAPPRQPSPPRPPAAAAVAAVPTPSPAAAAAGVGTRPGPGTGRAATTLSRLRPAAGGMRCPQLRRTKTLPPAPPPTPRLLLPATWTYRSPP